MRKAGGFAGLLYFSGKITTDTAKFRFPYLAGKTKGAFFSQLVGSDRRADRCFPRTAEAVGPYPKPLSPFFPFAIAGALGTSLAFGRGLNFVSFVNHACENLRMIFQGGSGVGLGQKLGGARIGGIILQDSHAKIAGL